MSSVNIYELDLDDAAPALPPASFPVGGVSREQLLLRQQVDAEADEEFEAGDIPMAIAVAVPHAVQADAFLKNANVNLLHELEATDSAPPSYYAKSDPTTGSNLVRMTDENIHAAVKEWCLPTSREAAMRIYGHISEWNTSLVMDCTALFKGQKEFNDDISRWDVSNVKSMKSMLEDATAFNQPIGDWDVSKVQNMRGMFCGAHAFNQPIGGWDVSEVEKMQSMFCGARSFNQPIGGWDVSKVEDMVLMFCGAHAFNQPIGEWDVSNVEGMSGMFISATVFKQPLRWGRRARVKNPGDCCIIM